MFVKLTKYTVVNTDQVQAVSIDEDAPKRVRVDFVNNQWFYEDYETPELAENALEEIVEKLNGGGQIGWLDKRRKGEQ